MYILQLRQEKDVLSLPKVSWIPDKCQQKSMTENVKHHICHILVKYVDFLKPFESVIPQYVTHKFIELTKAKSLFLNCELIEASENSASGMISIMQRIHELSVPHARLTDKKVYERVVFGGDVLTNERAFSAQQNMQLNRSDVDRLVGLIHRPEGLHREMNFLLVSLLCFVIFLFCVMFSKFSFLFLLKSVWVIYTFINHEMERKIL